MPASARNGAASSAHDVYEVAKRPSMDVALGDRQISSSLFSKLRWSNPCKSSYWRLYSFLPGRSSRCLLVAAVLCAIVAGAPLPLMAVIFRDIIDAFPPPEHQLDQAIYRILGISFAYFVSTWLWTVCWDAIGDRVCRSLQQSLVRRIVGMDMKFFDTTTFDLTTILTADTQTVQRGTSQKVGLFIQSISYFVATFITAFVLNPALAGILFAVVLPCLLLLVGLGSSLVARFSRYANSWSDKAAGVAEDAIYSAHIVQAFSAHATLSDRYVECLRKGSRWAFKQSIAAASMLALILFLCYAVNSLAFFVGVRLNASSGTVYAVVFLILDASFVFNQVGPFIANIAAAAEAGSRIVGLIESPATSIDVYEESGPILSDQDIDASDIAFKNVCFSYPARPSSRILDDVTLAFRPGTSTGIIGLSGSGKSTLINLIMRFYDPSLGDITVGRHHLPALNLRNWRSRIALVDQTPTLFSGTIFENIKAGLIDCDGMSEETVRETCDVAAREAGVDFLDCLSDGMDTQVSHAHGLSGGQKQRICLARAIVRGPKILLMDEPTSALDSISEAKIMQSLARLAASGCTIVMIAHRLSTVRNSTNIVVMGEGKVLEQGSHETLLKHGQSYPRMLDAQRMKLSSNTSNDSISSESTSSEINVEAVAVDKGEGDIAVPRPRKSREKHHSHKSRSQHTLLRRCLSLHRPELPLLIIGAGCGIVAGCIIVGETIVFGHLISALNTISNPNQLMQRVDFFSLMLFVISLVALSMYTVSGSSFGLVSATFQMRARDLALRNILRQDVTWLQRPENAPSKLMASLNADVNHIAGLSGVIIGSAISVTVGIVAGLVVAIASAWEIALVLISIIPTVIVAGYARVKLLKAFEQRHGEEFKSAAALAAEACANIRTVAAYGLESDVLKQYADATEAPYRHGVMFSIFGNLALSFSYSLIFFTYPLAYWWGTQQVRNGHYSQTEFFITLPAFLFTAQTSGQLFTMAPELTAAIAAARRIFKILDHEPSILTTPIRSSSDRFLGQSSRSEQNSQPVEVGEKPTGSSIQLKNVSHSYASHPERMVLSDIELEIPAGHVIGLVGPSGAGKSSVISLLERFQDPIAGQVVVDDQDVKSMDVDKHRSRLSLVPQEPSLFSGSVSFNVALGASVGQQVSQEDIERACRTVGLHSFISSLSEGYDTDIGTRGSKLSGGQKQRIAIARALIRNPQVMLMDESTSAMDSSSEQEIQKAVIEARTGRTTIVVAHRLSTVQCADKIFVFDQGRIVESGSHSSLITSKGLYADMARAQAL